LGTTRVYILAKELGIKSSAVVKKCQDEGLDVKNHMSTISAGLAATIREWFSEGDNITTVETAERVDLKKVRIKKKKKPPEKKAKTTDKTWSRSYSSGYTTTTYSNNWQREIFKEIKLPKAPRVFMSLLSYQKMKY